MAPSVKGQGKGNGSAEVVGHEVKVLHPGMREQSAQALAVGQNRVVRITRLVGLAEAKMIDGDAPEASPEARDDGCASAEELGVPCTKTTAGPDPPSR